MGSMNITVIGTGYVGAVTGTCLAELGNRITFVGRNREKLDLLDSGKTPIYELGLEELLTTNIERIKTTADLSSAVKETSIQMY
jgi:UDPglucose 6-dehydrogenase